VIGFVERHSPYQNFADAFMAEVLRGLHSVARQYNYHVLFEPASDQDGSTIDFIQLIRERHVDGIVLSGPRYDDDAIIQMSREGMPIVLQGRLPGSHIPEVDVDNFGGARLATEHLLALGHRRIGMVTNGPLIYTAAADRRSGYLYALQECGINTDESLIQVGAFSPESGYQAMRRLLAVKPRPTAVFVASDVVAIGAIEAARRAGLRIPADLALVGFDDIPWASYLNPPLTTVRLPAHALGWQAGLMLIRMLNQEEIETKTFLLETQLIVRASCGAQPQ
jgi:LacI family transcriptional regulator